MLRETILATVAVLLASFVVPQPVIENLGAPVFLPGLSVRVCTTGPLGRRA